MLGIPELGSTGAGRAVLGLPLNKEHAKNVPGVNSTNNLLVYLAFN